jgi:hypothetical protein
LTTQPGQLCFNTVHTIGDAAIDYRAGGVSAGANPGIRISRFAFGIVEIFQCRIEIVCLRKSHPDVVEQRRSLG